MFSHTLRSFNHHKLSRIHIGLKPTRSEVSKEPQELSVSTPFEVPKESNNFLNNKGKIKTEI